MTDYLDWRSTLSLDQVFAAGDSFSYPAYLPGNSDSLLYLSVIKNEKSRSVLMLRTADGIRCITPEPYNLRTKVNEYGGKPYWVQDGEIIFSNQEDQCLYRQSVCAGEIDAPQRLTALPQQELVWMYTDVSRVAGDQYITIVEQEKPLENGSENSMYIAGINGPGLNLEPVALVHGADFYSNLVIDSNAARVAWVQWDHPNMPWDETELWVADLIVTDNQIRISNTQRVSLATGASVCQLLFADNGKLFFSVDFPAGDPLAEYWNVHMYDPMQGRVVRVTDKKLEFGYPHWIYGDHRCIQLDKSRLVTIGSAPDGDRLFSIDQNSLTVTPIDHAVGTYQHLAADGNGSIAVLVNHSRSGPELIHARLEANQLTTETVVDNPSLCDDISVAKHLRFATRDGEAAYGFYYAPCNRRYNGLQTDSRPPLIVMVHGGPTARAYGHFDIQKQYWTSRGFALFDVNHRGSSGYGRRFRDALYANWGELDISDVIDGVDVLIAAGKVDPERICIRGKSAGGYAVLRALTEYPDYFRAGACYYGIGNLVTLAESTHKFERYYTDRLINETYDAKRANAPDSQFYLRSPVHKIDQLKSAMIVFQGLLDKVVPPSVAAEIIDVLRKAEVPHAYVEYSDEGHGFRQIENNIDAWTKELQFYRGVLSLPANT